MLESIPLWYQYTFVFMLGLIMGSFLDVVATRFHTGKSLNGRSRCLSCGHELTWYELVPLLSYILLRGRCRICHARIPFRLFGAELMCGFLYIWVFSVGMPPVMLLLSLILVSVLVVVALYDIRHMVIPNVFVYSVSLIAIAILLVQIKSLHNIYTLLPHLYAGCAAFAFYASLWAVSKGRWIGFGDAKLAIPFALIVGPLGTLSFIIYSFWIGASISICILLIQALLKRGQKRLPFLRVPLTIKSEVPFAPFMIMAFILVYLTGSNVLEFINTVLYALY